MSAPFRRDPTVVQLWSGAFSCERCDAPLHRDVRLCDDCQTDADERRGDDIDRADGQPDEAQEWADFDPEC